MSKHLLLEDDGMKLFAELNTTGNVLIHMDVEEGVWSLSTYKRWKLIWNNVLAKFKSEGIDEVFSLIPKDCKIEKFQKLFGLSPVIDFGPFTLYRKVI